MKYICSNGHIFNEDEMITVSEDRGEFWGEPCSESIGACPHCKDTDIGEYEQCEYCMYKDLCVNFMENEGDCDDFWDEQDFYDLKKDEKRYHTLWTDLKNKLYKENRDMWETMSQMEKDYEKERKKKCH